MTLPRGSRREPPGKPGPVAAGSHEANDLETSRGSLRGDPTGAVRQAGGGLGLLSLASGSWHERIGGTGTPGPSMRRRRLRRRRNGCRRKLRPVSRPENQTLPRERPRWHHGLAPQEAAVPRRRETRYRRAGILLPLPSDTAAEEQNAFRLVPRGPKGERLTRDGVRRTAGNLATADGDKS